MCMAVTCTSWFGDAMLAVAALVYALGLPVLIFEIVRHSRSDEYLPIKRVAHIHSGIMLLFTVSLLLLSGTQNVEHDLSLEEHAA